VNEVVSLLPRTQGLTEDTGLRYMRGVACEAGEEATTHRRDAPIVKEGVMTVATFHSLTAIAVAMTTLPAAAQVQREIPKAVGTMSQAQQARRALATGAECLLRQKPSNVRSFLRMYPDSRDAARTATYLNRGECVDGSTGAISMQFSATALRGALFKASYINDYADAAPTLIAAPLTVQADVAGQDAIAAESFVVQRRFAECVVRREPVKARSAVLADTESAAEQSALIALQPAFEACLQDKQPEMTKSMFAGVLAETLYRMAGPANG
jgi:hypothetical protein